MAAIDRKPARPGWYEYTVIALLSAAVSGLAVWHYGVVADTRPALLATGPSHPSTTGPVAPSCDAASRATQFPLSMPKMYENMLEYQKVLDSKAQRSSIVGNIAWFPWQVWFYSAHASRPCVRTICEIGFGAGHSTMMYMSVNPTAQLYTFDIFQLGAFQDAGVEYHKQSPHGARWHPIKGDSKQTVPQFAQEHPDIKCDLVHVDGDHSTPAVYHDIANFKLLSRPDTVVLIDDANEAPTQGDMKRATEERITDEWDCMDALDQTDQRFASLPAYHKRFCTTRYLFEQR